jgi:hypothetical protein
MTIRELHQAIAAEDQINFGQTIFTQVHSAKRHIRALIQLVVPLNELRKDIGANPAYIVQRHVLHPIKIPATHIEHGADIEVGPQHRETLSDDPRLIKIRSTAGYRIVGAPFVFRDDVAKYVLGGAGQPQTHQFKEKRLRSRDALYGVLQFGGNFVMPATLPPREASVSEGLLAFEF